jgi:hypothetical protein
VTIGSGARATATGLDSEQIVEERHNEVVVQIAAVRSAYHEGKDG